MKVEYVNPFLTASKDILSQVCSINVTKNQLFVKQGFVKLKDVTITVGITGDVKGNIIINFDKETAMSIASRMMGGFEVTELNEITTSAVSELCNMIAGQSGIHFNELKKNIDITPPIIQINNENSILNYEKQTVCIPLGLDEINRVMEIDVSID